MKKQEQYEYVTKYKEESLVDAILNQVDLPNSLIDSIVESGNMPEIVEKPEPEYSSACHICGQNHGGWFE